MNAPMGPLASGQRMRARARRGRTGAVVPPGRPLPVNIKILPRPMAGSCSILLTSEPAFTFGQPLHLSTRKNCSDNRDHLSGQELADAPSARLAGSQAE